MAVGSRYSQGVNVVNWPMGRVLLSYFASKYVRLILGIPVHDTTAGFVCFKRQTLEQIGLDKIKLKGYGFQVEMKYRVFKKGLKIVGSSYHFYQPNAGRKQDEWRYHR
ncbi:hypothetical protein BPO_1283 [Bergeyella porcorum]|uniref:Uncharacterized protein n=1 Tax=Bergeyella porcorum TaxID=1735111 RepID=A0AAU0F1H9_9FLAO